MLSRFAPVKTSDEPGRRRLVAAIICHLRNPRIAEMVLENLWYHGGVKYRLLAWILMPNHLHALVEIWDVPLSDVVKSWKSYTAKEALKILRSADGLEQRALSG